MSASLFLNSSVFADESYPLKGLGYGPIRDGQNAINGPFPTLDQLLEDFTIITKLTDNVMLFKVTPDLSDTLEAVSNDFPDMKITLNLSLHSDNDEEITNEIQSAIELSILHPEAIDAIIVGDDLLFYGKSDEIQLLEYIDEIKQDVPENIQITSSNFFPIWERSAALVGRVNFILLQTNSYWNGFSVDDEIESIKNQYFLLKNKYPSKEIALNGVGWPSAGQVIGCAVASPENQKIFFEKFLRFTNDEDIKYFIFEAFDEKWKPGKPGSEPPCQKKISTTFEYHDNAERNWGILSSLGEIKKELGDIIKIDIHENSRQVRIIDFTSFPSNKELAASSPTGQTVWIKDYYPTLVIDHFPTEEWSFEIDTNSIDDGIVKYNLYGKGLDNIHEILLIRQFDMSKSEINFEVDGCLFEIQEKGQPITCVVIDFNSILSDPDDPQVKSPNNGDDILPVSFQIFLFNIVLASAIIVIVFYVAREGKIPSIVKKQ